MGISLKRLDPKYHQLGINKFADAGVDADLWFAMCDASADEMRRLMNAWAILRPSFCYDAASILGLGKARGKPLPTPAPGEVLVRVGAWSLQDLQTCDTIVRHNLMWNLGMYNEFPFSRVKLTPGIYRLRLPVPNSNYKNLATQKNLLRDGEDVAPAALVAVALLCHLKQTGKDLLDNDSARCADAPSSWDSVHLSVRKGRVFVAAYYHGRRDDDVWLSAARKS